MYKRQIYGGPGLGKTHLMHSIGHFIIDQNPDTKVLYVTSEEFTNEVIESIRNGNSSAMTKFRDKYRTVAVSYTHLDVYKRQPCILNKNINLFSCVIR